MSDLTIEQWSLLLTGITTATVVIGSTIALLSLRTMSKSRRMESIRSLIELLQITRKDRRIVLTEFSFNPDSPTEIDLDTEHHVRNVIDSLNFIGLLVERRLLPAKTVFGIFYPTIIRCCDRLAVYIRHHEETIGGRYGRRVLKLGQRACLYHDCHKRHREHDIFSEAKREVPRQLVYKTHTKSGISGLFQRVVWFLRRTLRAY